MKIELLKNNKRFSTKIGERIKQDGIDELSTHSAILIIYLSNIQLTTINKTHLNSSKIIYESPAIKIDRKNLKLGSKNIFIPAVCAVPCKKYSCN